MPILKRKARTKSKPKAKPKAIERSIGAAHPFPPGSEVGIFRNADVAGTQGEPGPGPVASATVADDGELVVTVSEPGAYVAGGQTEAGYRRINFNVN
jgi:hypothetical protein